MLSGRVVDSGGQPVAGASVVVQTAGDPRSAPSSVRVADVGTVRAVTDPRGRFTIAAMEGPALHADLRLWAEAGNLVSRTVRVGRRRGMLPDLELDVGTFYSVRLVWLTSGLPVADAELLGLMRCTGPHSAERITYQGVTGTDGTMRLGPVPVDCVLHILHAAHDAAPLHQFRTLTFATGPDGVHHATLSMTPGVTASGVVEYTSGEPATHARLGPWSEDDGDPAPSRIRLADEHGRFTVSGIRPGGYLCVYPRIHPDDFVQIGAGPSEPMLMRMIDAPAGASVDVGRLRILEERHAELRVVDLSRRPIQGALVHHLHPDQMYGWTAEVSGADGTVRLLCARPQEATTVVVRYRDDRGRWRSCNFSFAAMPVADSVIELAIRVK